MSNVTWNGSAADWTTSGDWSGGQTPGVLDTAVIASGSVLVATTDSINAGSLSLTGGSLTVQGSLNLATANGGNGYVSTVAISGGSLTVDGGALVLGSYLNGASGTVVVANSGTFQWNGTSPSLVDGRTGSTSGLTIDLRSGYAAFEQPFDGHLEDFGTGDVLTFNGRITGESYAGNVLAISTDAGLSYRLNIVGNYQASNFAFSPDQYSVSYSGAPAIAVPTIAGLTTSSDSGTKGDNRTDKTPGIGGSGTSGDTIAIYLDNGSTALGTTTVVNGAWTFDLPTTPSPGSHSVTATATRSGSTSAEATYDFDIDPVPQAPSVTGLTAATDTGSSSSDGVTRDTTIGAQGTGKTGDGIDVFVDGSTVSAGSATVTAGAWSIAALNGTLSEGKHAIRATQADSYGNVSILSSSYDVVVDTTAPGIAVSGPVAGDDAIDAAEAAAGVTISGTTTAEDGQTVSVQILDAAKAAVDSYAVAATGGAYSVSVTAAQAQALADGGYTVTAEVSDRAGNPAATASRAITVDRTAPGITAVSETGTGIDADGNGALGVGRTATVTIATSEPVTVAGGTPTLTLNDGGTASYTGPSGAATDRLTFSYVVRSGQNTANLAVTALSLGGATVTDAAGNPVDASLSGASVPSGLLAVDTTPPVVSSPAVTAPQNGGSSPIGIAAPSDNLTAAGRLAIAAVSLPTDGTVTLGDGTSPVTAGQILTSAQLAGLRFTPTPGLFSQSSTFAYTVTDGAGNVSRGSAALDVGAPGAPTITGTHASTSSAEAPLAPFTGVTISDPSSAAGATGTLTIVLTGQGGTLTEGPGYGGPRTLAGGDGRYTLTGTAAGLTAELAALSFAPAGGAPGTTGTTSFVLTDRSTAGPSVTDGTTIVADTAASPSPPTNNTPTPTPTPTPDTVSLSSNVAYARGRFRLTGSASSAAGVSGVRISAVLDDGTRQDLGAATVGADGTFTFSDRIGSSSQSFLEATLIDGSGQQAVSADPGFSLTGGLDRTGFASRQTVYTADGGDITSTSLFRTDGSRKVDVQASGLTLASGFFDRFANHAAPDNTFVFDPGHGLDVVSGFRVGGTDHDTLSFLGSDFGGDVASVLRSAHDAKGGVVILDPTSGDTVKLAGLTKAELVHNRSDFAFHA